MSDNLKVAKECGFHVYANTLGNTNNVDGTEHSLRTYTSRILASQQAAHDAEIARMKEEMAKWIALSQANEQIAILVQKRADKAERACAMKDEALKDIARGQLQVPDFEKYAVRVATDALSTSPQQVSDWERKQLEPLRAQVAMLADTVASSLYRKTLDQQRDYDNFARLALANTQATAEQFIAECEQRGAADMCDWLADNPPRTLGMWSHMELHDKADELRATSKKAG